MSSIRSVVKGIEVARTLRGGRTRPLRSPSISVSNALLSKVGIALAILAIWQIIVMLWLPSYLPTPWGIIRKAGPTMASSDFTGSLWPTMKSVIIGLVVGCSSGVAVGLLTGRVWWLRSLIAPYVNGLYAMPLLALVPMLTLWLGYSDATRTAVVIISGFLPCAVSTSDGVRHVPQLLIDAAKVLRISPWRFPIDLLLPSTLPYVVAGVQVAVGRILVGAVVVEFLASINGIGFFIITEARSFNQNEAFVAVLVLAAVGLGATMACQLLLGRIAPWHGAAR